MCRYDYSLCYRIAKLYYIEVHFYALYVCMCTCMCGLQNGKFIFLEHVATKNQRSILGAVQFMIRRPFMFLFGCRIANDTEANIRKANFSNVKITYFEATEMLIPKPAVPMISRLTRYHVSGVATK